MYYYFTLLYLLTSSFTTALALLYFILHTSSCLKNKNRRKNQSVIRIHKIIWSNHSDSIKQYWKKKSHCIQTKTGDASDERSEFFWNTEHHMRKDDTRWSNNHNSITYFNSSPKMVLIVFDLEDDIKIASQDIQNKIASWISEGSGWTIKFVNGHWINVVQYNPVQGSLYINLPSELKNPTKDSSTLKTMTMTVSNGVTSDLWVHKTIILGELKEVISII